MKRRRDALNRTLAFCTLVFTLEQIEAQGTLQWTVTFDGPPAIGPTDAIVITNYTEQDVGFTGIGPNGRFGRSGGAEVNEAFPRDGSAYIVAAFGDSLALSSLSGQRFGLVSVDLAEFSTFYNFPRTVQFVGYKPDGSIVMTELTTDGVIDGSGPLADFQTFTFDSRFADLIRVEVPTDTWSLDNMVFSQIPEPASAALLLLGGLLFLAFRIRK